MNWQATVSITPKAGLRDPDGATIEDALHALGWGDVAAVHVGRTISFTVAGDDEECARRSVIEMCEQILANPVIEDYSITLDQTAGVT